MVCSKEFHLVQVTVSQWNIDECKIGYTIYSKCSDEDIIKLMCFIIVDGITMFARFIVGVQYVVEQFSSLVVSY